MAVIAVVFVVGVLGRMPLIAFVLCLFVASLPRSLLGYAVERRRVLLRDQMVGAARSLTSQFRAGLSDIEGLRAVARDIPMPLGRELRQVVADFDRGDDLHHALTTMKERLEIDVVSVFVITLLTCKTTGGRVSDAMGTIVDSLQELQRIERKRESDTAGGRTEVLVMALFPAFLAGLLWMIDPASIGLLFSTFWGQIVVSAIFVLTYGAVRWAFWLITALE